MSYSSKNYQVQGGDEWVIGGKLTIQEGAEVTGIASSPPSTLENQTESTATTIADLKTDFNSLLQKLKSSGLMEADA